MAISELRTCVYVDGFNLYYRALRGTGYKWLNLQLLCEQLLAPENRIVQIRYFTAPVTGKQDPDAPIRQQQYLRALQTIPRFTIHYGSFLARVKTRPLADPVPGSPTHVRVLDMEEKGSDVKLATHLLNDAWHDRFDVALVLSQDTDLLEPLRIVRDERAKQIGLVCLDGKPPGKLARYSSFVRHLTHARLASAQFPEAIAVKKGRKVIRRPPAWKHPGTTNEIA